ncbi:MAG: hypothetical protein ACOY3F_06480 [Bacillota bacterium]
MFMYFTSHALVGAAPGTSTGSPGGAVVAGLFSPLSPCYSS